MLDDALLKLLGSPTAKNAFMKFLATAGLVRSGHGHAGTVQERFKNDRDGQLHDTVRVWCIDAKRLSTVSEKEKDQFAASSVIDRQRGGSSRSRNSWHFRNFAISHDARR